MRNRRIIYIGNFGPSHSTENHIKATFESLGFKVTPIQEDKIMDYREVIEEVEKQDYLFLLYTRTWARTGILYGEILQHIKIPTVSFHLDLYWGLSREQGLENDTFFKSDYVFSADGGHQKEFKKIGVNHYWLSPGCFEKECYLGEKKKQYEKDVIFVGSYRYHREWNYRRKLICWLRDTYGEKFRLWGDSDCVRGEDLNNLYASAKVAVGDSTYSPFYWSDRVSETLGRGGFLIHPKVEGLDKEYKYYKHLVPYHYGDFKSLKMIIDYYISHDKEREKIRLAGNRWVKKNHTYTNKVNQILSTLKDKKIICD